MKNFACLLAVAVAAATTWAQPARADDHLSQPGFIEPVEHHAESHYGPTFDEPPSQVGVDVVDYTEPAGPTGYCCESSCGSDATCCCESACCCESSCGCRPSWSDCGSLFGKCCLGEPCTLQDRISPCCSWNYGGWVEFGYHTDNVRQSQANSDLLSFRDVPDDVHLNQAWLFVEKQAQSRCCCCDWGFRADIMYGTDAQKTQAFGNPGAANRNQGTFDASFDHGEYGWAIPQLYGELAYGDWSVIAGHFYTLVGYEVVPAPHNFFYSHSLTMFNSEPFTHTGVVTTYGGVDGLEIYNGWTLGWDTGFDQFFQGSSYLGGFKLDMNDCVSFAYLATAGNFGFRSSGDDDGYSHSMVLDMQLSSRLNYVLQSDHVRHHGLFGNAALNDLQVNDIGINQYLIYTLNDCWSIGGRLEWWKSNTPTANQAAAVTDMQSYYAITGGVNYKPHANVIIRPEVRYDWTPAEDNYTALTGQTDYNQATFGVDAIFTF